MEQTQILRKENKILFTDDEIENIFKAHGLTLNELTKDLLSKGEWSDFLEDINMDPDTDKHGKIKLNREKDGTVKVNYQFHQEQLVIPKKIGNYVLSEDDKLKLNNNEIVGPLKYENSELYIRVDPQLNAVTVRTANEISIPNVIGHNKSMKFDGYALTDRDKNKLANGGALATKLFCGKDGYFTANFAITDDKKGVIFTNIRSVPLNKVKETEAKYNLPTSDLTNNAINAGKEALSEKQGTTILENVTHSSNNLIINNPKSIQIQAEAPKNYLDLNDDTIKNEYKHKLGCHPSNIKFVIIGEGDIESINKASELNSIQKVKESYNECKSVELTDHPLKYSLYLVDSQKMPNIDSYAGDHAEFQEYKENLIKAAKELGTVLVPDISKALEKKGSIDLNSDTKQQDNLQTTDLSKEFNDAIEKHDFKKLNELSERGWKPSDKEINGLDKKEHLTPNDKIAVKSIFNIENKPENSAGNSKTEQKYKAQLKFQAGQEQKKSSGRGKKAKDIINRAFNDM